jgi:hypothetical protein
MRKSKQSVEKHGKTPKSISEMPDEEFILWASYQLGNNDPKELKIVKEESKRRRTINPKESN